MHTSHAQDRAPETRGRLIHWASHYDLVTGVFMLGRERSVREMTIGMAQVKPGDKVLDVGCGTGSLTLVAAAHAGTTGEVHGIDASPEMIVVAQKKAKRAGLDVDFQIGLIEQIAFPDNYFDIVLSSLMLHHLPDDLKERGFDEIRRVLKPGGRFFAVDFEPPTSPVVRHIVSHLLQHRMMHVDVRGYVPMMEAAGLKNVEVGKTKYGMLSFVRGSKGE